MTAIARRTLDDIADVDHGDIDRVAVARTLAGHRPAVLSPSEVRAVIAAGRGQGLDDCALGRLLGCSPDNVARIRTGRRG